MAVHFSEQSNKPVGSIKAGNFSTSHITIHFSRLCTMVLLKPIFVEVERGYEGKVSCILDLCTRKVV
jgi:hypothetical protein